MISHVKKLRKKIDNFSENQSKDVNAFCEQTSNLMNFKAGGTYFCHCVINV
jgi:hypothetical protein